MFYFFPALRKTIKYGNNPTLKLLVWAPGVLLYAERNHPQETMENKKVGVGVGRNTDAPLATRTTEAKKEKREHEKEESTPLNHRILRRSVTLIYFAFLLVLVVAPAPSSCRQVRADSQPLLATKEGWGGWRGYIFIEGVEEGDKRNK